MAALSSGAVRYRYYTRWGLNAEEVAKVVLFCGVTVMLGLSALGGLVCLVNPTDVSKLLGVNGSNSLWIGLGVLSLPVAYVVLSATVRSPLRLGKWRFTMPNIRLAIAQIAIGTLNFTFVAACLHQVLASEAPVSFVQSATAFVLANVAILVAHVPGGLGVLEATVTTVLPGAASIGGARGIPRDLFPGAVAVGIARLRDQRVDNPQHEKEAARQGSRETVRASSATFVVANRAAGDRQVRTPARGSSRCNQDQPRTLSSNAPGCSAQR